MAIDPRLSERRREVAEDRARRNVTRLVRLLVVLILLSALVWLFLSPLLSLDEVVVNGVSASSAHSILADEEIVAGRPLVLIRAEATIEALEEDPWIREADVDLDWPNRATVTIEERVPAAWVETAGGWDRRAVDGVVLPIDGGPDDTMARLEFDDIAPDAAGEDPTVLGALEFAANLPPELAAKTTVQTREDAELWAVASGYQVRLGRAVEMREKALSLVALLAENPAPGSELILIAPTNPAVAGPGSQP